MNLNATLLGQVITFSIFVWFTMKFIWPPVIKALEERQKKIAEGLDASERGKRSLELSKQEAAKILHDAKIESSSIVDQANLRGEKLVENARTQGKIESQRLVERGQAEIEQNVEKAKIDLRNRVLEISLSIASKILEEKIDKERHEKMINDLINQVEI